VSVADSALKVKMQINRWRDIFTVVAWAGLIWLVIRRANDGIVSEVFWIDLLYNASALAFAIAFVVGIAILIGRFINVAMRFSIVVWVLLLFAAAAIEPLLAAGYDFATCAHVQLSR